MERADGGAAGPRPVRDDLSRAYGETNALKRFYNSVMARGDAVIANSRFTADLIAQRYGTPRQRLEAIHRGRLRKVRSGADRLRAGFGSTRALGADPGAPVILHAARLTAWKGQVC